MPDRPEPIFRDVAGGAEFSVRVSPGAAQPRVLGPLGPALKIAVSAPPEKGKANRALVEFLARTLGCPKQAVRVLTGETCRDKRLFVAGCSAAACRAALAPGSR